MNERNIFLNNKLGSELLFVAAGEKVCKLYLVTCLIQSLYLLPWILKCDFVLISLMVDWGIYHC